MATTNELLPVEQRTGLLAAAAVPGQSVATYKPTAANASTASANGYDAMSVTVNKDQDTVQGQLDGILRKDSPLMQQADRRGREAAAARGLLNSSLSAGAAQEAVISQALPIAQQDATTYFAANTKSVDATNAARNFFAGAQNQASLANAQLGTDVSKFNANAANEASAKAADAINNAAIAKLDADTRMSLGKLDAETRLTTANLDAKTRMDLGNLDANTRMSLGKLDADTRMNLGRLDSQTRLQTAQLDANTQMEAERLRAQTSTANAQLDAATRLQTAQLDAQTRLQATQMDAASRAQLTAIETRNRELLQANQNAANMYNSAANAITNISIQSNLTQEAKDAAIQTQLNMLNEGLRATGDVASLDLSSYFQTGSLRPDTNASGAVTIDNMDRERYLRDYPDVVHAWQDYNTSGRYNGRIAYALPGS